MNERYAFLDMNSKLVWNFRDIVHTMRHISEGKGSQKRVLMILLESGRMTQRELTEKIGVQPGSASEVIGKLEAAGLILRMPSETDRRTMDITLTDTGRAAAEEAGIEREKRHEQMFASLSEKEKDMLLQLLEKVNGDWEKKYRRDKFGDMELNHRKGRGHHHHKRHEEE